MNGTGESDSQAVVLAALSAATPNVSEVLECIARRLEAFGCVLWEVLPYEDIRSDSPGGHLYTVASWFAVEASEVFAMHNLPIADSATGWVVRQEKPQFGRRARLTGAIVNNSFLGRHRVEQLCAVPVTLPGGRPGALTAYRRDRDPDFDRDCLERLGQMAVLVAPLLQSIRDKTNLALVGEVDSLLLQRAGAEPGDRLLSKEEMRAVLGRTCQAVARTFQCLEVSVFLEDRLEERPEDRGPFELQATTWDGPLPFRRLDADRSQGLTSWVLAERKEVRIFNLVHFERDLESIRRTYPDIRWRNSMGVLEVTRRLFGAGGDDELPPVSYMATPIPFGGRLLGVVRCTGATRGPFYFSHREVELLRAVAAQIAEFWAVWTNRRELQEENNLAMALVATLDRLNSQVVHQLQQPAPDEKRIQIQALKHLRQNIVRQADSCEILVHDAARDEFVLALNPSRPRLPAGASSPAPVAAEVLRTGKSAVVEEPGQDPAYAARHPGLRRWLILPVGVGKRRSGVLVVGSSRPGAFPRNALRSMELLGQQLGLYHDSVEAVERLRRAEAEAKSNFDETMRLINQRDLAYQDLAHGLKGPSAQARLWAEAAVGRMRTEADRMELLRGRGLCRKVARVAFSMGLLANWGKGFRRLEIKSCVLDVAHLMRLVDEAVEDAGLFVEGERQILFRVAHDPVALHATECIKVDYGYLEQAVSNLLENAAKYSYPNTVVWVRTTLTRSREYLQISVQDVGLTLSKEEAVLCRQRGWRAEQARWVTGEGSGIGLFLVDYIMGALGGRLEVIPTRTEDGVTEFRLLVPVQRAG